MVVERMSGSDHWSFHAQVKALEFEAVMREHVPGCVIVCLQQPAGDTMRVDAARSAGDPLITMFEPIDEFPSEALITMLRLALQ